MKIIALEAENVKHLRVVNISPDGALVVIGGDNEQGKTCVLDSIEYALNGARSIPIKPIRQGQSKARVVLNLGDIVVTRTFTSKGTNLIVKNKDGATFPSPQAMLDKLVGQLSFDPLEFSKMDAGKQSEVLKHLVGLDFDSLNAEYRKRFDERTVVNREGKTLKARLDQMMKYDDTPDKEVSVQEIGEKYAEALEHNRVIEHTHRGFDIHKEELVLLKKRVKELEKNIKTEQEIVDVNKTVDVNSIQQAMKKTEQMNSQVRENRLYDEVNAQVVDLRKKSLSLSNKITGLVDKKAESMAKAKFPIKGLAIGDEGVTFDDIPFVQCSSAQRIRVSVAIGLAMNPKLRVLLIREGSMLDSKNLAMVAKMAEKADAQIWVERVSQGKECQIIMEDGSVKQKEVACVK